MRQNPAENDLPQESGDGFTQELDSSLLDDSRWDLIEGCFPAGKRPWRKRRRKGGRPPLPPRLCFEAVLWRLASGQPWSELPARFGSPRTIQRRRDLWSAQGILAAAWRRHLRASAPEERLAWSARLSARPVGKRGFWHWELLGAARAYVRFP